MKWQTWDGRYAGETRGAQPFAWEPEAGAHRITCSTEEGVSDSVRVSVVTEP